MKPAWHLALALGLLAIPSWVFAQAPGPYYARGTFYCSSDLMGIPLPDTCFGYGPVLELFDDGAHGDDAAGDQVYGAYVACNQQPGLLEFKIANADWTFAEPSSPPNPFINGRLFTSFVGEVVHFRLGVGDAGGGWVPDVAVANDHGYPEGATLELIGSSPELGSWNSGIPVEHVGSIWQATVTLANVGSHEFKFRVQGTWDFANFGYHYNNNFGANGLFFTTVPDQTMLIQFDEHTGRIRAIEATTEVRSTPWGRIKALYR